jgi:hypothetical protein
VECPECDQEGRNPESGRRATKRIPDVFRYLEEEEEEEEEEEDVKGVWCAVEGSGVFCLVFVLINT